MNLSNDGAPVEINVRGAFALILRNESGQPLAFEKTNVGYKVVLTVKDADEGREDGDTSD